MNPFDESTVDKVYSAPPLAIQAPRQGRKQLPFRPFGGTVKPHQGTKESMQGDSGRSLGAIITKQGRQMCTPGYVMKNGICVMELSTPVCQPGWYNKDGVCVKAPREFLAGAPSRSTPTRYPPTREDRALVNRVRHLLQTRNKMKEKQTGESEKNGTNIALMVLAVLLGILIVVVMLVYI